MDGALTFAFESGNLAGAWSASGSIDGDRLGVEYNLIMQHADFENAIYRRIQ